MKLKSFKEFISENHLDFPRNNKSVDERVKDIIYTINKINATNEAFDSSFDIIKTEDRGHYHYFRIRDFDFRIMIETLTEDFSLQVAFQFFNPKINKWIYDGIFNILKPREILALFGTIYKVIIKYEFDVLAVIGTDSKKSKVYSNMFKKITKATKF